MHSSSTRLKDMIMAMKDVNAVLQTSNILNRSTGEMFQAHGNFSHQYTSSLKKYAVVLFCCEEMFVVCNIYIKQSSFHY